MDLDGDGLIDVLSGSYSRPGKDMAGLFQVLWGTGKGTFAAAKALDGSDGSPLLIAGGKEVTDRICTRPTAADLDGDGVLDIVSGNFGGTFALFRGEGNGKFAPQHSWLQADGAPMQVQAHSDPFPIDWDGDGDLDLLTGSAEGGVFLFPNLGTRTQPRFGRKVALLPPRLRHVDDAIWGDGELQAPQGDTRVFAADVNGDGKLDLLVGDCVTLLTPAAGLDEAKAKTQLADWQRQEKQVLSATGDSEAAQKQFQDAYSKLQKQRDAIVRTDRTGFVWVLYQK